jgi:hypothetical protein
MAHPLCIMCMERDGTPEPATIADHVEPHHGDWTKFRLGRLQSLCAQCHNRTKRQSEVMGYSRDVGANGLPLDPLHPWYR